MTDKQYTLLDELYFIQTIDSLQRELGWDRAEVIKILLELSDNGWLIIFFKDHEIVVSKNELEQQIENYGFFASKKGLFAHNSN